MILNVLDHAGEVLGSAVSSLINIFNPPVVLLGGDIALAREMRLGVHLKAAQLAGLSQRPLPAPLPVAASCHDATELAHAERLRCDFAVLGPVQATPTHPGAATLGWNAFAALRERGTIPLYAIGGLGPDDIGTARAHGAQGIAAIRATWLLHL